MTIAFLHARPRLTVRLDDQALSTALEARLISVVVRQALGTPAVLELSFADVPAAQLASLRPGISATVSVAPGGDLFSGRVTEIAQDYAPDRGSVFKLIARDALHKLACRESLLTLENVSARDLAERFASDVGLGLQCHESVPKREIAVQHQQSDLDFLNDFAGDAGLYPIVRYAELHLMSLAGDGDDGLELTLGANLLAFRGRVVAERNLPAGKLFSRDPVTMEPRETQASLARQDQVEMRDPGDLGVGDHHLLNRMTGSPQEAEALLQASLDRAAADVLVAEGLTEGDAALMPGRIIDVRGVADAFVASYVVTRVQHRMTATEGFVSEFSTQRPLAERPARGPVMTIGEITKVNDPEKLGRCQVMLHEFGGAIAGWMPVVMPGAGARKGVVALPDEGDEVAILLPEGDPTRGVILGNIIGTKRLPKGAEDTPRGICLRSKDGQVLELKGSGGAALLANRSGSLVDIRPGRMRIAAASDLIIEAPGKTITIRANEIKMERG